MNETVRYLTARYMAAPHAAVRTAAQDAATMRRQAGTKILAIQRRRFEVLQEVISTRDAERIRVIRRWLEGGTA